MAQITKNQNNAYLNVVIGCLIAGMVGIFLNSINNMHVGSILFYRLLFGFIVLFGFIILTKRLNEIRLTKNKRYIALIGVLNVITLFSYFSAIQYTNISIGVLLLYTAPLYVIILSPIFLKERITMQGIVGLMLAITGILMIVNPNDAAIAGGTYVNYTLGVIFGLLAGLSFGTTIITVNYLKESYTGLSQLFWSTGISVIILIPFAINTSYQIVLDNLSILIAFGVITTAIGALFYLSGIVAIKAQKAGVLALLEPVSGIMFGFAILGDPIFSSTIKGCICIMLAGFIVSMSKEQFFKLQKIPSIVIGRARNDNRYQEQAINTELY
ncbi:DMT family transporter [Methanosalsum natronophilum]|uniref:EamA family transporter n=1 Tax=Methanosalsum natronophilum TaxID=768733 RepID=A0A424YUX2_9EURY|nr:DMT family transporter [Methanosalsum natronophilum]MCS3923238.1 drug/metabolite transporter (DMT)-like permease [Methanosalsum natronophilum]RQD82850.1 MAG: EamA family transporter [Methanosalsum natronophilum]